MLCDFSRATKFRVTATEYAPTGISVKSYELEEIITEETCPVGLELPMTRKVVQID